MLNKLEALRIFCTAAETLQFKEAASRLAVSPPVVTRVIAELEDYLGEPLFQRNTRQTKLTDFGREFLPQAQQLLDDSERVFVHAKQRDEDEMGGMVRITVPDLPDEENVLLELLGRLKAYPKLVLDWQKNTVRVNAVEAQIDIGVRIGQAPTDSLLIVKHLGTVKERIVAAPELVAQYGLPNGLEDLKKRYPLNVEHDLNNGRYWAWYFNDQQSLLPPKPVFVSNTVQNTLAAARSGRAVAYVLDWLCEPYLRNGELVELLPDIRKQQWTAYLYRPQRSVTPTRVRVVFEMLAEILAARFNREAV
ncbi:LysR family transcriptional regulator [Neisseria sp. CCUG12390]|uniref:LysR family transcriptional regulator n=1 Tax=Neisseria sp. CCUG12390 TaxID=3392035 RepID=UPI003A102C65